MVCVLDFKRDVGLWHGILCVSNHSFSWKDNSVVFSGFVRVLSHLFLIKIFYIFPSVYYYLTCFIPGIMFRHSLVREYL